MGFPDVSEWTSCILMAALSFFRFPVPERDWNIWSLIKVKAGIKTPINMIPDACFDPFAAWQVRANRGGFRGMSGNSKSADKAGRGVTARQDEFKAFLFLTVFLAPILAVAIVGGYGFIVWMSHVIFGPSPG